MHSLRQTYHRLISHFGRTRSYHKWMLVSILLEIVLILTQDRSTVCVEHTIGSEIVLDALMERLGEMGHLDSRFFPFGDIISVDAR